MTRWLRRLVALAAFAAAVPLLAQTYHGGLRGAVREAGAVVPGVTLTLTNEANGAVRTTTTNHAGEYAFVQVEPGPYTLKATMQGFKTIENKGIRIGTQQFITMDITLEVGQLEEQITVESQATPLETSNASVSSTIDSKTLDTLPTPGRNPFFLAITTPGVIPTGDPQFVRQQDQTNSSLLSLGGGPRRGNNYTLDGVSIVDMRNRATVIPSIEAVEEVRIQVSTYDAEMGRTGGGVFNMTGKSGSNSWHGSALFQNRPKFSQSRPYFAQKACDEATPETEAEACDKGDLYFYLYAGSIGGPIVKNKTFFWASAEGYRTNTPTSNTLLMPTQRELNGDFSQSGVTIYDPLTTRPNPNGSGYIRDPFPGNVIPANRISPVGANLRQYWPESGQVTAGLKDVSITGTFKLDQIWNEKVRSSAMYAIYDSTEPAPRYFGGEIGEKPGDPGDGALYRTVHVIAVNNTITPNPTTVAHVRLGYTSFSDDCVPTDFDPGTLGFSSSFANSVPQKKFPYFYVGGYESYGGRIFGDRAPQDTDYYSWDFNASMSKLWGRHTVKFGASYRKIGMKNTSFGSSSGNFTFDGQFTSADPLNPTNTDQHGLAALLLGYPSAGDITVATPNDFYIDYYAGYIHDDFRVNRNLTVNLGLRYEFEQGLQEKNNAFTVGFDRERPWDFQVPGSPPLRGGLQYAGVDGYPTHQSDPTKAKFSPRAGFAWSIKDKTVVRGGYGLYWAPYQYAFPTENRLGARGFTEVTSYVASFDGGLTPCPTCNIVNPFPNGFAQPPGSSLGIQTGAGGTVNFVDQFRKSAKVHQYSVDLQHELPGRMVAGIGYIGSTTRRIGVGGNDSDVVNINQLDPRFQSLGTALSESVPNPYFGNPAFGAFANQETITRGQLLRPYPQFGDLLAHQVSEGRGQYHSVVLRLERPMVGGWGGRISYTYSKSKNNIFGETNAFSGAAAQSRIVNSYDFDAEYSYSLVDTPHRLVFAGTWELPFGRNKKHLSEPGLARTLLGGWSITGVGTYQSGFPSVITQASNNSGVFGRIQRPNLVGDPSTSGSTYDHYDPSCTCISNWFNAAAWSNAPAFTFGNAPRTETGQRTPFKAQTDIAFQKVEPLGPGDLMIRFEMINIFNNAQFNSPNMSFGSSNFGRITGTRGFPRLLQLTLRYAF
jgi:hypothetical protein